VANAVTEVPAAATGVAPAGHPRAGAMCTVGISACCGGGSVGEGPVPAETGRLAGLAHAESTSAAANGQQRPRMVGDAFMGDTPGPGPGTASA
jgi:hypothetical protein